MTQIDHDAPRIYSFTPTAMKSIADGGGVFHVLVRADGRLSFWDDGDSDWGMGNGLVVEQWDEATRAMYYVAFGPRLDEYEAQDN